MAIPRKASVILEPYKHEPTELGLFQAYMAIKNGPNKCVTFHRKYLGTGAFQDLLAWDLEISKRCGQAVVSSPWVQVCLDQLEHEGEHFGLEPYGRDLIA